MITDIGNAASYYIIKATDETGELTTIKYLLDGLELSANLGIETFMTGQCSSSSEMQFERLTDAGINRVFDIPALHYKFYLMVF